MFPSSESLLQNGPTGQLIAKPTLPTITTVASGTTTKRRHSKSPKNHLTTTTSTSSTIAIRRKTLSPSRRPTPPTAAPTHTPLRHGFLLNLDDDNESMDLRFDPFRGEPRASDGQRLFNRKRMDSSPSVRNRHRGQGETIESARENLLKALELFVEW